MGSDVWVIPPDNITKALKFFFYDEILYLLALPIIKIAICCTYLRIFPNEQFRKLTWIAIGLNVAFAITFFCTTIFQCSPINMVSGSPSASPSHSTVRLTQPRRRGFDGTERLRGIATTSTPKDGRLPPSTSFSTLS
jgi:hypothetical protein